MTNYLHPLGPDMAQKTDPYDPRTPSGCEPTIVPLAWFKEATSQGWDNRWYMANRMMPIDGVYQYTFKRVP